MAQRYCGSVNISVKIVWDRNMGDGYRCNLSQNGKRLEAVHVGCPIAQNIAIDSSEAIDRAAHAACSFATNVDGFDYDDKGFAIRRKR